MLERLRGVWMNAGAGACAQGRDFRNITRAPATHTHLHVDRSHFPIKTSGGGMSLPGDSELLRTALMSALSAILSVCRCRPACFPRKEEG